MIFSIGDRVSFIDEAGEAIVKSIEGIQLVLIDEFGFERSCSANEVVLSDSNQYKDLEVYEKVEDQKIETAFKKKNKHVPVIDLHMENLVDRHSHMSNHEIVMFQLRHFKNKLDNLTKNGVRELIVVHGIGTGKLKAEVRFILNGYDKIEYMDDHVGGYGVGATRIFVK